MRQLNINTDMEIDINRVTLKMTYDQVTLNIMNRMELGHRPSVSYGPASVDVIQELYEETELGHGQS